MLKGGVLQYFKNYSMITNFERETHELNDYELHTLLPIVVHGLSNKVGKDKAITNKDICKALKVGGCKITDTRLRKIVHHIRTHNLVPLLIATSKGYHVATNKDEVDTYILSLSERINSISSVKTALIKQLQNV